MLLKILLNRIIKQLIEGVEIYIDSTEIEIKHRYIRRILLKFNNLNQSLQQDQSN